MEQQNSNKEELLSNLKKALEIQLGVDEIHKQIDGVKKRNIRVDRRYRNFL